MDQSIINCLKLISPNKTIRIRKSCDGIELDVAISINDLIVKGSTAQRPVDPEEPNLYYNTDNHEFEYWNGTAWVPFGSSTPPANDVFTFTFPFNLGGSTSTGLPYSIPILLS